jgi:hypothetical protein
MIQEQHSPSEPGSTEASSAADRGSLPHRIQALGDKASELSETLDRIEKNLQEAAGESKD